MAARRAPGCLWLLLLPPGALLIVVAAGIWISSAPVHPDRIGIPMTISVAPPPRWEAAAERARRAALAHLADENLPGLSVAVGVGDRVVWAEGFGYADTRTRTRVTPDVRFRIGTASIALTSAAAGLLMEQDRLHLDGEAHALVPGFPPRTPPVTLRDLMAHTAGLEHGVGDEGPLFTQHCEGAAEALQHFVRWPVLSEPGTEFHFSALGWIVASAAVEAAAQRPLIEFMQERVFQPLGMTQTGADEGPLERDDDFPLFNLFRELVLDPRTKSGMGPAGANMAPLRQATAYFPRFIENPRHGMHVMRPLDLSCYSGASVFVSTAPDLVKFALGVQKGKLLKPATVETLQTPQRLASGRETGYGLGWETGESAVGGRRVRSAGHSGVLLGGDVADLRIYPEQGVAVAVLANISHAKTRRLGERIAAEFLKEALGGQR